jgi:hypothetical protein
MNDSTADPAYRAVTLSAIPLGVIALGLIANVLVPYGWPLKWMMVTTSFDDGLSPLLAIYGCAGILAVLIVRATARGTAPKALATVVALIGITAATVMTMITVYFFSEGNYWTQVLTFVAPVAIAPVITFHALRVREWQRMHRLLGAFGIAALPYACPLVPGMFNLFSGGLVYVAADLTLLALFVRGMRS